MIRGVGKIVIEVEDQDRAKEFWTQTLGFELVQDTRYHQERWLEVRTPDQGTVLALTLGQGERPVGADDRLPTSNVFFSCDDLDRTVRELTARGVRFPQPPVEYPFGWWSVFEDPDGNRFALTPQAR